jgi:hypothetical protein
MSVEVKELLYEIKPILKNLGEMLNPIEIEGENRETLEEKIIEVEIDDYDKMDAFSKEYEIFGVNINFKERTRIEFVYNGRKWTPFEVKINSRVYQGKRAKTRYFEELYGRSFKRLDQRTT